MWKHADNGIDIYFDTEAGAVRVSNKEPILEGGKPIIRRELGVFRSKESWDKSPYREKVTNPSMEFDVELFWKDLHVKKIKRRKIYMAVSFACVLAGTLLVLAANYILTLEMAVLGQALAGLGIFFGLVSYFCWVKS